jgi:FkbM family methyltransferase
MFRQLVIDGTYQDEVLVALEHLLRPGEVFWDIGANYGFMSIYVDKHFDGAVRTFAFEPNPVVLSELRRNLDLNRTRSVEVVETCLSDSVGESQFFTSADHSWNATLIPAFADAYGQNVPITVKTSTIDDVLRAVPAPNAIKLDVEGSEHLVIRGGTQFLSRARVPIVAEYNVESIRGAGLTPEQYLEMYSRLGYRFYLLKKPIVGLHRWESRYEVSRPSELPPLCNLILLK